MRKNTTHNLTVAAMLSAVAFILMFIEFPIPMLIPSFVKMDFSDLPALLGAFPDNTESTHCRHRLSAAEGRNGPPVWA